MKKKSYFNSKDDQPKDPEKFLDGLIDFMKLKNDFQLAQKLEVAPPVISKVRNKRVGISAAFLIRSHEVTGLAIKDLREMMTADSVIA